MATSRFIVLSLKDIIKTTLFVVMGIMLLVFMIYILTPEESNSSSIYKSGMYTNTVSVGAIELPITVVLTNNSISDIYLDESIIDTTTYPLIIPTFNDIRDDFLDNGVMDNPVDVMTYETSTLIADSINTSILQAQY